jgi:hypothetical protein
MAVAVAAGRRDEAAKGGEEFDGRDDRATVGGGPRRGVADLADGGLASRRCGGAPVGMALDVEALESEGRPGAVSEQPLAPGRFTPVVERWLGQARL